MGVSLTVISILFVGTAALMGDSGTTHLSASPRIVAFFLIVRVLSKSFQAISMLLEEHVMTITGLTPSELTGVIGGWSFFLSTVILLPLEDSLQTFRMVYHSSPVAILSLLSVVVFGVWTFLSLQITKQASAVARMVFDQLTVVIVWGAQLVIRWVVVGTKYEEEFGKTGEQWTNWSWLQLAGFGLMCFGAFVFQGIVACGRGAGSPDGEMFAKLEERNALAGGRNGQRGESTLVLV
jgi:hypothetical protein